MKAIAAALCVFLSGCDDFPRDPEDTLEQARGGAMRVGVSQNPPWTTVEEGRIGGIEAALVESFAESLGAEVHWVRGSEGELLRSLERYELAIVVSGMTSDTPWKRRVALTRPYLTEDILVGFPPGTDAPNSLAGLRIAVHPLAGLGTELRKRGAIPVDVRDEFAGGLPVAAPSWRLRARGYLLTGFRLGEDRRVIAVPPGENGFLVALERFLARREEEIRKALTVGEPPGQPLSIENREPN